ncbi:MAG: PilZ domain-containing protein [Clostridiaceae bacterium]|jgi:hypothetical protein|nr:PilZ domain-containing protein [Clostridiaceae bacterium]
MGLTEGSVVTMRHYSMINVFSSIVDEIKDDKITVKLPKECQKATFLEDDPLVTAYELDTKAVIKGGRIAGYDKDAGLLTYTEDVLDEGSRMRSYERFPVSLYADYRVVEMPGYKKHYALIKDISDYGLMLYSKEDHFKGLKLNLDIYLARDILSLTAEIVRKVDRGGYYEYGLKIRHNGPIVFNQIKNFVRKEQEELIGKYSK